MFGSWPIATKTPSHARSDSAPVTVSRRRQRLDRTVPDDVLHHRVPHELDLRVRERAVLHDLRRAQLVAAVHDGDGRRELREEQRLFERGVAAADDRDRLLAEEEAVARRARRHAVAEQSLLVREPEHARGGAGADDDRARAELALADPDAERRRREVDAVGVGGDELGAESLGLLAELDHQLGAEDAVGEARVVLDVGGEHELPARADALEHDRGEVGAAGVDGGGEAGRARTDDDDVVHLRHSRPSLAGSQCPAERPDDHEDSTEDQVGEPDVAHEDHEHAEQCDREHRDTATSTKKATSSPKTTAREAFCAGTTVLSRTRATACSSASTASVVQSATAVLLSRGRPRFRVPERTRTPRSVERADLARIGDDRVDERVPSGRSVATTIASRVPKRPVPIATTVPSGSSSAHGSAARPPLTSAADSLGAAASSVCPTPRERRAAPERRVEVGERSSRSPTSPSVARRRPCSSAPAAAGPPTDARRSLATLRRRRVRRRATCPPGVQSGRRASCRRPRPRRSATPPPTASTTTADGRRHPPTRPARRCRRTRTAVVTSRRRVSSSSGSTSSRRPRRSSRAVVVSHHCSDVRRGCPGSRGAPASRARPRAMRERTVPGGSLEHLGDLRVVEVAQVAQHDRDPEVGRDVAQRGVDVEPVADLGVERRAPAPDGSTVERSIGSGRRACAATRRGRRW